MSIPPRMHVQLSNMHLTKTQSTYQLKEIYIVYVKESAAYRVVFTSLCENPNERGTSERRLLTQTTSEYNLVQSNFYDVSC